MLQRSVETGQFTSWDFGQRLRNSGILGSMGSIGDCYDNAMIESFWGTLQLELLDTKEWATRDELANAIFEWIECWYNPTRRHSSIGMHSPVDFDAHIPRQIATVDPTPRVSGLRGEVQSQLSESTLPALAAVSNSRTAEVVGDVWISLR